MRSVIGKSEKCFTNFSNLAKLLIIAGIIILLAGVILIFFPGAFRWFGNLPGDIKIKTENTRFYFPIVTMILISIVITLIVNIIRRL